jgi:hypothetical protein
MFAVILILNVIDLSALETRALLGNALMCAIRCARQSVFPAMQAVAMSSSSNASDAPPVTA